MSPTPLGVTIIARKPDGSEVDVTEGVQVLYDHTIHSMDWGSGFLSVEDAIPIHEIAVTCGFRGAAEPKRYMIERQREDYRYGRDKELIKEYGEANPRHGLPHVPPDVRKQIWEQAVKEATEKFPPPEEDS